MNRCALRLVLSGLFACGLALATACGGGNDNADAAVEPDAPPQVGTLSLDWEIAYGATSLACVQVAASSLSIRATPSGGGSGVPSVLSCDPGTGSVTLPAGTFDVTVSLITSNNSQLSEPQLFPEVQIQPGQPATLGALTFQVPPQGNVEFMISTDSGTSNCAPEADGGAATNDIYIEFRDSLGECVAADFTIAAGANQPAGTFSSDCAGTTFGGCIENDQVVRVEGVPSGGNSMVFTGYKAGVECFSRTSQFTVPGNDLSLTLVLQQLVRAQIPACDPSL